MGRYKVPVRMAPCSGTAPDSRRRRGPSEAHDRSVAWLMGERPATWNARDDHAFGRTRAVLSPAGRPYVRLVSSLSHLVCLGVALATPLVGSAGTIPDPATAVLPELSGGPLQVLPTPLDDRLLSGTVFIGYRGTDGQTTGTVLTVAPWWRSFLRVGAEVTPSSRDGAVRFLWALGLDDWRDRSFFLHVQDGGPVRPNEPFTLRHAEASAGYRLPLVCGGPFCLAPAALATLPFSGGPHLGARTTVTVGQTWFATGAVGWTIPHALAGTAAAPPWRVSFALGRWDGAPGGLYVTYRDELAIDGETSLSTWKKPDRQGNGVVAAGVNWSY